MDWNDPRPLKSWPGEALAVELMNQSRPGSRYLLVVSALETLGTLGRPYPHDQREHAEYVLGVYLRGLAAAAIVADAAGGTRHWTSARDYALNGAEVEFLPPEGVLLGTLTVALLGISRAAELTDAWLDAPDGHTEVVELIQRVLAGATQARMTQVGERAEDVHGG